MDEKAIVAAVLTAGLLGSNNLVNALQQQSAGRPPIATANGEAARAVSLYREVLRELQRQSP
jgi:hypothetical protein